MVPNATQVKFGYPQTSIAETAHWSVQLRPQQPTLGALVLVYKEPVTAFGDVSAAAFVELGGLVKTIETILKGFVDYERINYLMLMMVDPDVHFHIFPRYAGARAFGGVGFADAGWPGPPALGEAVTLSDEVRDALVVGLRQAWPGAHSP